MKFFVRIISVCLVFVLLCGAELYVSSSDSYPITGYYGTELFPLNYPVTSSFMNGIGTGYQRWYEFELSSYLEKCRYDNRTEVDYFTCLWTKNYYIGDPEIWPEYYLDSVEPILAGAQVDYQRETASGKWLYKHRIDSYSWNEDKLTVECSADYYISYKCNRDTYFQHETYQVHTFGDYYSYVYLALTDKNDGSLVHMGKIRDFSLKPEHKFKYEVEKEGGETTVRLGEELKAIADTGEIIGHDWTTTESFEVQMPEFFDPDMHDVTIYFYISGYYINGYRNEIYLGEKNFHDPYKISTDGYGKPSPEPDVTTAEPDVTTSEPDITTSEPEPEPEPVPGDADDDGDVDLADVILTMKYVAGWDVYPNTNLADMNKNGRIDLEDITIMLKIIAGWNIQVR